MAKLKVLVPMAGFGQRFKDAGYPNYKPFIPIEGKRMVDWAIAAYPGDLEKIFIVNPTLLTESDLNDLRQIPNARIIEIEAHKLGPAYSIYLASSHLDDDASYFISYGDIFWTWAFPEPAVLDGQDGIVFTRRDFHPHLVKNNFSAFCRPADDTLNRLAEIREKNSFTNDWMAEPLSIGVFFVRSGSAMKAAIASMIAAEDKVATEYFPSVMFNHLLAQGAEIALYDVDFFVHWGVPEQLEDVTTWLRIVADLQPGRARRSGLIPRNFCCMGGRGERMKGVSTLPKPLIPIQGQPMVQLVMDAFQCRDNHFMTTSAIVKQLQSTSLGADVHDIGEPTSSQLDTLKQASHLLEQQDNFLLTSCDAYGGYKQADLVGLIADEDPDAIIFCFSPSLLQSKLAGAHTHVSIVDGRVSDVHIKSKSTDSDLGLAGFFWFKHGDIFSALDDVTVAGRQEGSADHILKYMVGQGMLVMAFELDYYVHLGSADEYREMDFWLRYYNVFRSVKE